MLGERVAGKYELKRLLGQGAMGAVYQGVHVDIGKRLAIKLINPEFCESSEAVARFRREARAASAVESDYIVQIYDFGRDERFGLYMVIEYLEGEDLETRLSRERWITEPEAVSIGIQIGRGLVKAHAAGIIHRDLKPANIFLIKRDDGSVHTKILDFGISKFEPERGPESLAEPTLTAHGTTLGTPQYMSPEQCDGKGDVDVRTDVWALAALLYEMIAGEPAVVDRGGHIRTMQAILDEDIPPLRSRASWANPALTRIIDAAIRRDRERRTRDVATLVAGLLEVYPDAGTRPSVGHIHRATDISDLRPMTAAPPATPSNPGIAAVPPAPPVPKSPAPPPVFAGPRITDTANPPSSGDSPSSVDDGIAFFARGEALPRELQDLRSRRKKV